MASTDFAALIVAVLLACAGALVAVDLATLAGLAIYRAITGERDIPRYRGHHRKGRHRA